ncbi:MAG: VOC family protein, partial [Betaproteobacteria bacterium]
MAQSVLKTKFISHGTLGSKDLEATRRFYEEFLGLEVVRTSPVSLMIRLGGNHVYAVVYTKKKERMPRVYHNGLDVDTDTEVD